MTTFTRPAPKPVRKKKEPKPLGQRKIKVIETEPMEDTEQITVVDFLDWCGVVYTATANGMYAPPATRVRMKRMGMKKGIQDLLIFTPPPAYPGKVGVALEMKRRKNYDVEPEQLEWKAKLANCGWLTYIARGCDEALEILKDCGYGVRK